MNPRRAAALLLVAVAACSGSASEETPPADPGILGATHASYAESAETTNGTTAGAEDTGYVLDADGLAITGAFEAGSPTQDHYVFGSGPYRTMDVIVLVDGRRLNATGDGLSCWYDAVANDGYSPMSGCWSTNMWAGASANTSFYLSLYPDATLAGKAYTLQLKGNTLR